MTPWLLPLPFKGVRGKRALRATGSQFSPNAEALCAEAGRAGVGMGFPSAAEKPSNELSNNRRTSNPSPPKPSP